MTHQKPAGISAEEWAQTPPAVRALLAHMARSASAPNDEGDTMAMPPTEPAGDDGLTMPLPPPTDDDGATAYLPPTRSADDDDGLTTPLPPPAGTRPGGVDDGVTAFIPPAAGAANPLPPSPPTADDGATARMPAETPPPSGQKSRGAAAPTVQAELNLWAQNIVLQKRYRLRKILGKGGFGAAYLAEDTKLKRGCVVKQMLSPAGISAKEMDTHRANFEREASLLVQLNHPGHPNIPEIYDYFSDDSGSYLVMKYIEGRSLKGLMQASGGKIEWREAVRTIIDACSALNYMHTNGAEPVMHHDIKPDNILLGDDGRIWLVDFGLAQVKAVADTAAFSAGQSAAGSVGYTPFEQWLGESTPVSDVYAAGVTLHHLVTGQNPLDAYREADGKIQVTIERLRDLHGQLDPIRKIDRKLPRELEAIIRQAVAPEPQQRLTALQFQHQLEVLVSGAKNAALFTFKNGSSAHTIPKLVDLCEQNRVEAQGYLYRGDFERWFTLINRNDLADAATGAVRYGEKGKDGLEKFLKLIMPNLFWRRLWRAGIRVGRVGLQVLLVLALAAVLAVVAGTLLSRWLVQRTIANYPWNYYALTLDQPNEFSQVYLTDNAKNLTRAYLEDIEIDPQATNTVNLRANLGNLITFSVPAKVQLVAGQPQLTVSEINGIPFYWITANLSQGINQGIAGALQNAPVNIAGLSVTDDAVIINVDKSTGVAYSPPTPDPALVPTTTPTPLPTATPRAEALLAVFNDLDRAILVDIEGEQWLVPARDSKAIEKAPGTYNYKVTYVENGQLAAQGTKTWTYRAYKWRIGLGGETFE